MKWSELGRNGKPNKPRKGRLEKSVMAAVLAYLELRADTFGWRANVSAGVLPSGQFARSNMRGVSDWIGLQAPAGRLIAVECKREKGGGLSIDQLRFRDNVVKHGGLFVEARSVEDVARALGPCTASVAKILPARVIHR